MSETVPCFDCQEHLRPDVRTCPHCGHRQITPRVAAFYVLVTPVAALTFAAVTYLLGALALPELLAGLPGVALATVVGIATYSLVLGTVGYEYWYRHSHLGGDERIDESQASSELPSDGGERIEDSRISSDSQSDGGERIEDSRISSDSQSDGGEFHTGSSRNGGGSG